ncbi:MAG TPA: hypothetical protein VHP34_02455 [Alphaproteobacteria bacterium]|nr:hypothetical protein [Alphaproteobacteria bacterium]
MSCCMQHITAKRNAWAIAPQTAMAVNNGMTNAVNNGNGAAFLYAPESFAGVKTPKGTTIG